MKSNFLLIRDEIEEEIANIENLKDDFTKIKTKNLELEMKIRLYASILSDFYMAAERIFKIIAKDLDQDLPEAKDWHKKLLRQMSIEFSEFRSKVINKELYHNLEEYLRFRHLVRNIYGFQLNYNRFEHLIQNFPKTVDKFINQLTQFLNSMQEIIEKATKENDNIN